LDIGGDGGGGLGLGLRRALGDEPGAFIFGYGISDMGYGIWDMGYGECPYIQLYKVLVDSIIET